MASRIKEIAADIEAAVAASPDLAGKLTSASKLSIWRILAFAVAASIWALEMLFAELSRQVDSRLATLKPHTLRWYVTMAKAFQYGRQLVADEDRYDNTGLDAAAIEAEQVVKYAAVIEVPKGLRVKVATEDGGDLAVLPVAELTALRSYMGRVKDAGVRLYVDSTPADALRLDLTIYYDPLILDATGQRLDGTNNTPIQSAITGFLKDRMPFNGLFVPTLLIDALQAVPGVIIPQLMRAEARYGALPFVAVGALYQPDAGWLRVAPADLTLTFLPREPL